MNNAIKAISDKVFSDSLKIEKVEYRLNNSVSNTLSSDLKLSLYSNSQNLNRVVLQLKDNKVEQSYPTISGIIQNFIVFVIRLGLSIVIISGLTVMFVMIFPSAIILAIVLFIPAVIVCVIILYKNQYPIFF